MMVLPCIVVSPRKSAPALLTPGHSSGEATSPSLQPFARMYKKRATWASSESPTDAEW